MYKSNKKHIFQSAQSGNAALTDSSSKSIQWCNISNQEKVQNRDLKNGEFRGKERMWTQNPLTFRIKIDQFIVIAKQNYNPLKGTIIIIDYSI